ncbi:MAG TPA: hypothetical protein VL001_00435, partial [Candidimonas sp.]|nr:hypothetical protein [Candidimonas sp.]
AAQTLMVRAAGWLVAGRATVAGAPCGGLRLRMQGRDCSSDAFSDSWGLSDVASFAAASSSVRRAGSQGDALTADA